MGRTVRFLVAGAALAVAALSTVAVPAGTALAGSAPGSWRTCSVTTKGREPDNGGFRGVVPPGRQSARLLEDVQRDD